MKLSRLAISAVALIATQSFAVDSAPVAVQNSTTTAPGNCSFAHTWNSIRSYNGANWDVTISRSFGASYFYNTNCEEIKIANTATAPLFVGGNGAALSIGFGYGAPLTEMSFFVTALERAPSTRDYNAAHDDPPPVPAPTPTPNPAPNYTGKKCVFIINASVPYAPGGYIINYGNARCNYDPRAMTPEYILQ